MYKVDPGSQANCWVTQPLVGVNDTDSQDNVPATGFSKMD
jgi:hypothetical protein